MENKSVEIEFTGPSENSSYNTLTLTNVSSVSRLGAGDYVYVAVKHPNGRVDSHTFQAAYVKRLSVFNLHDLKAKVEEAATT